MHIKPHVLTFSSDTLTRRPQRSGTKARTLAARLRGRAPHHLTPQAILNPSPITPTSVTASTLREICQPYVPEHILQRMEEIGYVMPTNIQREALPYLFSGRDCILHAQTGSGKTLTHLLLIHSIINAEKSSVQALVVVPTRELGMQVTKVARTLSAKATGVDGEQKSCSIMALLDGGTLKRHKSWLKAEPPTVVVATVGSLCQMLEKHTFSLETVQVLIIDEDDWRKYAWLITICCPNFLCVMGIGGSMLPTWHAYAP